MALRITGSPAAPAAPTSLDLATRAERALHAGDLDGYAAAWGPAGDVRGDQGPYHARILLGETAMRLGGELPPGRAAGAYAVAADRLLGALEREPAEPRLLNLAGVLLYELWALEPAEKLFRAALRLDPEVADAAGNLTQIRRRRQAPGAAIPLPAPVKVALRGLSERAVRVASRARPAEDRTLTLAMIVRDEEEMLPRCLQAVMPAVDELVIVDTGSTDRTVEIAESFGARVLHHEWTGSFAEARNVSFDAATGDWILYLDADEVLVEDDLPALRELLGQTWREAHYLVETNYTGDDDDGTAVVHNALRLFRNRAGYRFDGRLHEQIADKLPGHLPERIGQSRVRVDHFGYLARVREAKDKGSRNIELLRRQMDEAPAVTPFMAFNLGSELAAAGDTAGAIVELRRSWEMLTAAGAVTAHGFAPSLIARLVKGLRIAGAHAEAEQRIEEGLRHFPAFTDLVFDHGFVALAQGDEELALQRFERCLELGEPPADYTSLSGVGTFLALAAAASVHQRRGDLDRARELLEQALREYPRFLGTVDPLAQVLLAGGTPADEVVARIEAGVADVNNSVRFLLGTALYEAGAVEQAGAQFQQVLAARPGNGPARVAAAEALLSAGRLEEAAKIAEAIDPADPCAATAARTAAFARLALGHAEVQLAGLPADERHAYEAWRRKVAGEATGVVPAAAAAPLATALEALLHLQAFEAFEQLESVLSDAALPARERRELLAGMYLRRGYLDSAADEWIAACEDTGPDADALLGLARVAAARGLEEDARLLAEGACELAPSDPRAPAMLAAMAV